MNSFCVTLQGGGCGGTRRSEQARPHVCDEEEAGADPVLAPDSFDCDSAERQSTLGSDAGEH